MLLGASRTTSRTLIPTVLSEAEGISQTKCACKEDRCHAHVGAFKLDNMALQDAV